jgi:hypothetical protein
MAGLPVSQLEGLALGYLRGQLAARAPQTLRFEGEFDEQPLDGEGQTALFSFELPPGTDVGSGAQPGAAEVKHYVAVGETGPNFFPAYGLDPDDAYSFHLGTRFVLEMGLQVVDASYEPPSARALLRAALVNYAAGATLEQEELAALFRCDEGLFAVYRLTLDGQDVYCMGADCPPGFYHMTEHPPQVALRLHLGKLIRAEAAGGGPPKP